MEQAGISIVWILPIYMVALMIAGGIALWSLKIEEDSEKSVQKHPNDKSEKLTPKNLDIEACAIPLQSMIKISNRDEGEINDSSTSNTSLKREDSSASHYQLFYDDVEF